MKTLLVVVSGIFLTLAMMFYVHARMRQEVALTATETIEETDDDYAVRTALYEHFGNDANTIQVKVRGNAVALFGEVSRRPTQELAEEVVMAVDGVVVVHNFLELAPGSAQEPLDAIISTAELEARDALLESGVKTRLASDIGDEALAISVEACDGVVSLRGDVPDHERHSVAVRAATSVGGVTRVIDLLEVSA